MVILPTHSVDLLVQRRLSEFHGINVEKCAAHLSVGIHQIQIRRIFILRNHLLRFLIIDQSHQFLDFLDLLFEFLISLFQGNFLLFHFQSSQTTLKLTAKPIVKANQDFFGGGEGFAGFIILHIFTPLSAITTIKISKSFRLLNFTAKLYGHFCQYPAISISLVHSTTTTTTSSQAHHPNFLLLQNLNLPQTIHCCEIVLVYLKS